MGNGTKEPVEISDAVRIGSEHLYSCRCDICREWWAELGPDGGEEGNYGPFAAWEIDEFIQERDKESEDVHD